MSKEARTKVVLDDDARKNLDVCVKAFAACGFGSAGPPVETTFAEIEEFGHEIGRIVAREVAERLTREHADHFEQEAPCPGCGALCELKEESLKRFLQTRDGDVPIIEPVCHCPVCNRDFFPSTHCAED